MTTTQSVQVLEFKPFKLTLLTLLKITLTYLK